MPDNGNGQYKTPVKHGGKKYNICESYPQDTSGHKTPMAKEAVGSGGLNHSINASEKGPAGPSVSGGKKGSMDY